MIICVAVDDNMGMMFNNRRQSQDKVLREYIINESKDTKLWINEYTKRQFEEPLADNIVVDDHFLYKASETDYCFVENVSLAEYEEKITKIILFKWNRIYPADMYLDIDLAQGKWKLTTVEEFEGNSHEKITKEIWEVL